MRALLFFCILFVSFNLHAERSFSNVFIAYSTIDNNSNAIESDGDGFSFGGQWEIGNQFYLIFASNSFELEAQDSEFRYETSSDQNLVGLGRFFNVGEKSKIDFSFATGRPSQDTTRIRLSNGTTATSSEDLTRGQTISLSYIHQTTEYLSISVGAVYQDIGVFEETGFTLNAIYSATTNTELGVALSELDDTNQLSFILQYVPERNK